MTILTVIFAAMFYEAWKAPRWVKETGLIALTFGIFSSLTGLMQMLGALQKTDVIEMQVLCGGIKVTLIPAMYGMVIYIISLVIRIVEKPRI